MRQAECVSEERFLLGESARLDTATGGVTWVDIDNGAMYYARPGFRNSRTLLRVPDIITAAVPAKFAGYGVALRDRIMAIDSRGGRRSSASLFADGAIGRLNDMAVDPAGRLLVGSMTLGAELGSECLWQVDDDGSLVVLDDDLTISNGLGWSPDGRTLYSVDSTPGRVHRREYDPATGRVGRRRLFVDFAELDGEPDGLAVDAAGCVWIACWGAGQVLGFDPMGKVVDGVTVDARLTTSCAFVGGDLSTMFITTANKEKPGGSLHAGCNFAIAMPTPGLPPVPWEVPTKFMLHSV